MTMGSKSARAARAKRATAARPAANPFMTESLIIC